jgi:hypothetical protein
MFTGKDETGRDGGADVSIAARRSDMGKRGMNVLDSIQKEAQT